MPCASGKCSVNDEWPPVSYSGKYFLNSRVFTRVVDGSVYVEKYEPGKKAMTTIHRAGDGFTQNPEVIYAIGSVYGATTVSLSKKPINPIFVPSE